MPQVAGFRGLAYISCSIDAAEFRQMFAYAGLVPQPRTCTVSFTDPEGYTHSVDVSASTLYEACVLAVASFRGASLFDVHIGPGTRLRVAVKQPEAVHEVQFGKLQEWLKGGARSLNESVVKARLRQVLAGQ